MLASGSFCAARTLSICISSHLVPVVVVVAAAANNEKEASRSLCQQSGDSRERNEAAAAVVKYCANSSKFIRNLRARGSAFSHTMSFSLFAQIHTHVRAFTLYYFLSSLSVIISAPSKAGKVNLERLRDAEYATCALRRRCVKSKLSARANAN